MTSGICFRSQNDAQALQKLETRADRGMGLNLMGCFAKGRGCDAGLVFKRRVETRL